MTTTRTFRENDRVSFSTNGGRTLATGRITALWTDSDGIDVATVEVYPNPFVLSAVPSQVDVAKLTLVGGAR